MEWSLPGIQLMASENEIGFCFQNTCGDFWGGNIFPLPQTLQPGGLENSEKFKKLMKTVFSEGKSLELSKKSYPKRSFIFKKYIKNEFGRFLMSSSGGKFDLKTYWNFAKNCSSAECTAPTTDLIIFVLYFVINENKKHCWEKSETISIIWSKIVQLL